MESSLESSGQQAKSNDEPGAITYLFDSLSMQLPGRFLYLL